LLTTGPAPAKQSLSLTRADARERSLCGSLNGDVLFLRFTVPGDSPLGFRQEQLMLPIMPRLSENADVAFHREMSNSSAKGFNNSELPMNDPEFAGADLFGIVFTFRF
jgi:hypothetical protein